MTMLVSINEIMKYNNAALLSRYGKEFSKNKLSPEKAFHNLMKFFWLSEKHLLDIKNNPNNETLKFNFNVYHEMAEIDDMWHTFLMFTQDYANFCECYFGKFIHHAPRDENEKINPEIFELELTRFLSYVYDNLGEETVSVWFAELLSKNE